MHGAVKFVRARKTKTVKEMGWDVQMDVYLH